jgi:hypothetical protein
VIRSLGAIVLGVVGWFGVATLGNWVLRAFLPGYTQVEATMAFTLPMQMSRLALGLVSSLCSGIVCAAIAGTRSIPPRVVAAILVALLLPVHYSLWDKFPVWYHLFFLISLAPAVLAGAELVCRLMSSKASRGSQA